MPARVHVRVSPSASVAVKVWTTPVLFSATRTVNPVPAGSSSITGAVLVARPTV